MQNVFREHLGQSYTFTEGGSQTSPDPLPSPPSPKFIEERWMIPMLMLFPLGHTHHFDQNT